LSEEYWRIPKPRKIVEMIRRKLGENHGVKRGKIVVREIAETFKSRTKLAITTAVAYMLWMSFYKVLSEGLNVLMPRYPGLLQSIFELAITSLIAAVTLYALSKWE